MGLPLPRCRASWAEKELAVTERIGTGPVSAETAAALAAPEPSTSEVRAWARSIGIAVPDRGRRRPENLAGMAMRTRPP